MAASIAGINFNSIKAFATLSEFPKAHLSVKLPSLNGSWRRGNWQGRIVYVRPVAATETDRLSGKVEESIKQAQEACSDDPVSGECAAAWDTVEELSAAVGHARDKKKEQSDPLENFCKDNPEDEECRTYDN